MKRTPKLYIDQYGNRYFAETVKALRAQIDGGGSKVSIMYIDLKGGGVARIGYVIGTHWLNEYTPTMKIITQPRYEEKATA